jgi:hypothetical protein
VSSSRAIRAGRAFVELFTDNRRLQRGLAAARARLTRFAAGVSSMGRQMLTWGGAALAPLLATTKVFANMGDNLDKMATRVGASVEFLSALGHAAALGGTELRNMETGIRRLQRSAYDAAAGSKSAADAFAELGVSVHDNAGVLKRTEALFMDVAEALAAEENNTKKAALASLLFGRAGTLLLPMLRDGKAGLVGMMEEAKRLGLVISTEDAAAAAELTDTLYRLKSIMGRIVFSVGRELAPILEEFAKWLADSTKIAREWIAENGHLIKLAFKLAAGLVAGGAALMALGLAASTAAAVLGGVSTAVSAIVAVVGALLTPMGLAAAAFVAWITYTGDLRKGIAWLTATFHELKDRALETFAGITDALMSGDFSAAAAVAWLGLKVEWIRGTNWLKSQWLELTAFMTDVWTHATADLAKILTESWYDSIALLKAPWASAAEMDADRREKAFALADIERQRGRDLAGNTSRQKIAEANARLKAAEAEKAAAIAAARAEREKQARGDPNKGYVNPRDAAAAKAAAAVGLAEAIAGTFSAAQVRGLSGGRNTPEEKMAAGIEEVANNTGRLVEAAREGGLVFG